jgi:hypothetical protein
MDSLIETLLTLIQLAVAGFVMWGGWLVFRDWFRGAPANDAAAQAPAPQAQAHDFERVASLVLLALLCTTLVAAA